MFGIMIGWAAITAHGVTTNPIREVPLVTLIMGGGLGTFATVISIIKTYVARESLSSEVASTLISSRYESMSPNLLKELKRIETTIGRHLNSDLKQQLKNTIAGFEDETRSIIHSGSEWNSQPEKNVLPPETQINDAR